MEICLKKELLVHSHLQMNCFPLQKNRKIGSVEYPGQMTNKKPPILNLIDYYYCYFVFFVFNPTRISLLLIY